MRKPNYCRTDAGADQLRSPDRPDHEMRRPLSSTFEYVAGPGRFSGTVSSNIPRLDSTAATPHDHAVRGLLPTSASRASRHHELWSDEGDGLRLLGRSRLVAMA